MDRLDAINQRLAARTGAQEEREILSLLREASDEELDRLVNEIDLRRLLEAMDDRALGPKMFQGLVTLLSLDRVEALSTRARARLIRAFQVGRTGSARERGVSNVLLTTRGLALTDLKNQIDSGRDHHDLCQLVFHDIDDAHLRSEILQHVTREAGAVEARGIKLLSDIDDTVYANWKDARYPKKTVYPGVRQLYRELATDAAGAPEVTFLTARPWERSGLVEAMAQRGLSAKGFGAPTVLSGSVSHLSNERIAAKKLENFTQYADLFGEYRFIFFGDNGQGDAILAARMREARPARVLATLIHEVVPLSEPERDAWAAKDVLCFENYVDAALALRARSLIDTAQVRRVAESAKEELEALDFSDAEARERRNAELEASIERI